MKCEEEQITPKTQLSSDNNDCGAVTVGLDEETPEKDRLSLEDQDSVEKDMMKITPKTQLSSDNNDCGAVTVGLDENAVSYVTIAFLLIHNGMDVLLSGGLAKGGWDSGGARGGD
ncbi:hypothetical protein ROHU_007946 [Labeo rohita]|uniref:Uncharacterized protein n=1 Tax=Labeo rohita TaxID=84645 RepID=A0A498MGB2_LABRO|nr:hypothetical protein ROHU_007946 [Labeo rohita]